ncbi:MAG TPA: plastocyanin/azurin family copper-binding protein [Ktedonobacteraceae bacterium]|nr:plastocyanin/azurin family copper-binding protein [Ktedonobacteraceae bacterium]
MNTLTTTLSSRRYSRLWFVLLAFAALVLLAACGGGGTTSTGTTPTAGGTTPTTAPSGSTPTTAPSGNTMAVSIISSNTFAFSPAAITIKVGTTVTWTNMTSAPHTVTSDDGKSFDSGISNPISASGGTYSHTFMQPGTFTYHCQIHPFMKATVIVQP